MCNNSSTTGELLETRALAGLRDRFFTPEIVSQLAVHLQRELDIQMRTAHIRRDEMEAALIETQRLIARLAKQRRRTMTASRSVMARLRNLER